jgi:small subunit ribosomal protein S5
VSVSVRRAKCRKRSARAWSARKSLIKIPLIDGRTLPHDVIGISGAGRVLMQPASPGTGVIAGGPVRAVVESAGVSDVLTKTLGTKTPRNVVNAVMAGLSELRDPEERLAQLGRTR